MCVHTCLHTQPAFDSISSRKEMLAALSGSENYVCTHIVMAYIVMAYTVMAYIGMAYIVIA